MVRRQCLIPVAVFCAFMLGGALLDASPSFAEARRPDRISITGCPFAGVTANCLMIKATDGTVYNISALTPRPRQKDRMIRIRGAATDKLSACGQGIVLDRIRWTRTRQRCPG